MYEKHSQRRIMETLLRIRIRSYKDNDLKLEVFNRLDKYHYTYKSYKEIES